MNNIFILTLMLVAVSGVWARPRGHRSHRSHRQAECTSIVYRPFTPQQVVCGTDGKTYLNEQHLLFENCIYHTDATVQKKGWCDESIQSVEDFKDILWSIVSWLIDELIEGMSDEEKNELLDFLNSLKSLGSSENSSEAIDGLLKSLDLNPEERNDVIQILKSIDLSSPSEEAQSNEMPDNEKSTNTGSEADDLAEFLKLFNWNGSSEEAQPNKISDNEESTNTNSDNTSLGNEIPSGSAENTENNFLSNILSE